MCINGILAAYNRGAKFFSAEGCLLLRSDDCKYKINCKKNSVQILFKKVSSLQLSVLKTCPLAKLFYYIISVSLQPYVWNTFFHFKHFQQTEEDYKWKWHKRLVELQQTSGLEKEGKAAKLMVMTFVYCSTWFFILWLKGRMSALCFPYQDQLTCLCDRVGRVLSCQSGQAWNNYLYKYQSICLLLFKNWPTEVFSGHSLPGSTQQALGTLCSKRACVVLLRYIPTTDHAHASCTR